VSARGGFSERSLVLVALGLMTSDLISPSTTTLYQISLRLHLEA